jgi:hypothetical protein
MNQQEPTMLKFSEDGRRMLEAAQQFIQDTTAVGTPVVGLAALVGILEHFFGLLDTLALIVGLMWGMDMLGGLTRSIVRERTFRAFSWHRLAAGVGKIAAVLLGLGVFGLLELVQIEAGMEAPIPLVAPMLAIAVTGFSVSILDQVADLWPWFGDRARTLLDRLHSRDRRQGD